MKTTHAWAILVVGLLFTALISLWVEQASEHAAIEDFGSDCDQIALKVHERLNAYALILRGGAGLFAATGSVDRQAWRNYVETLQAKGCVPGVQGVGFAEVIAHDQLPAHIARIRGEGFPEYTVRPSGERALYTSIIYLEPFRDRNLRAFGYDMFSEPVRRAAMERACDTGEVSLSGKVVLVQETTAEVQAGTLMYVPVYRNGAPASTVEQRRAALLGWVYSPYRMKDLMLGILANGAKYDGVNLHVYDGSESSPARLLFESQSQTPVSPTRFSQQRTLDFGCRQWLLAFEPVSSPLRYTTTWATMVGGGVLSCLICALAVSLVKMQSRALHIAEELTSEITKHEKLLKASEAHLRDILDSAPMMVWEAGSDARCVFFNKPWLDFTGRTMEQELGNGWAEGVHPDDYQRCLDIYLGAFDARRPFQMEYRLRRADGEYRWLLDNGGPRFSQGSVFVGYVGSCLDITGRKQAEEDRQKAMTELREASLYARNLLETSLDPLVTISPEGTISDVNAATESVTGLSRERLIGSDFTDYFTDPEMAQAGYMKAFSDGKVIDYALAIRHASGSITDVLYNASVYRNELGKVLGVFAAARDITERKAAEVRIERLTQLYSALSHSNQDIVHSASAEDLLPTICRDLVKYGGMKMVWIGMVDDSTGMVRPVASAGIGREYTDGIQISVKPEDPLGRGPIGTAIRENRPFWCQDFQNDPSTAPWHERGAQYGWSVIASLPLLRDGKPVGALTVYSLEAGIFDEEARDLLAEIASDISFALDRFVHKEERKRVELELRETQARLALAMDQAQLVYWEMDAATKTCTFNDQFYALYGTTAEREGGYQMPADVYACEFLPQEEQHLVSDAVAKLLAGEVDGLQLEHRIRRRDGELRYFLVRVNVVRDSAGRVVGTRGTKQDITMRKQMEEELEKKTAEMERFTYTVSHDLKSPLVTIKTFLGYLEKDLNNQKSERATKDLEFIHGAADKMVDLLNELLKLARVGYNKNEMEQVSLQEVVREALSLVAGQIAERGVQVEVTQEQVWLTGDRPRLVELFQNLLDNAVKFLGDQPKPQIEIGWEQVGDELRIFVRDNGKGIDPRYQNKVFGLFHKLDPNAPGSGMGLALVRRIVEMHGGKISVQSGGLGQGATFRFTLAKTQLRQPLPGLT